ncbi:MAG: DUF3737 family protein [Bacteroidales bacterium]|jgi:hypothetical protein|nr:DUF3737 family protein [Bacteroidales bacterium]
MKIISNQFFEGERPLFATSDIRLENVKFYPGESAVKECNRVEAYRCEFMCKYPFWHNNDASIENCLFTVYSRAAIWYSKNVRMLNTVVEAPKMFREIDGLYLENVKLPNAAECCWNCRNIEFRNVDVKCGDYLFMNSKNIRIDGFRLQGNYSFQDAKNVEIRNARLDSKDAFWNTENVTVYDSVISGEYLGWHSKNLRLVNCTISGTQALCYAKDLVMQNCVMKPDADLCFEYSTLQARINSPVHSVKNPGGGYIVAESIGEIIIDENCKNPGDCRIEVCDEAPCFSYEI